MDAARPVPRRRTRRVLLVRAQRLVLGYVYSICSRMVALCLCRRRQLLLTFLLHLSSDILALAVVFCRVDSQPARGAPRVRAGP